MASTFLVDKCLAALRQTLPKDQFIHLLGSWYTYRNSTNNEEDIPECILFKLCLFSSIGFDKECLKQYYQNKNEIICSSSSINTNITEYNDSHINVGQIHGTGTSSSKKIRIDDDIDHNGNDDDFYQLMAENNIDWIEQPKMLNRMDKQSLLKSKHFTGPGFLYPYTAHILYSLHLI
ncbi:hypothetical protein BLA29_005252 [Euroglyphus maynei]|uniref:Uncharacterized protein n=1 Tax=Euroglyphus maynei TaxID=6958 RepID=A0A1Y3BFM8_EURMA|nr:hypothetical protein BLA29_005252 [Euroglyphus maynei]